MIMTSMSRPSRKTIPDYLENVQCEYLILDYRTAEDVISRYKRSEPQFYPDSRFESMSNMRLCALHRADANEANEGSCGYVKNAITLAVMDGAFYTLLYPRVDLQNYGFGKTGLQLIARFENSCPNK